MTTQGSPVRVEIPPGVQHDAPVRVRGGGVKTRDRTGDLVIRIRIDTPEGITAGEQDLYRRILRIEEKRDGTERRFLGRYIPKFRGRGG
jgi:DnaJ-class molecular chaperone